MNFSVTDTVGPYQILEELGRGGMGRVFKVEHNLTQRFEAMKVLERGRPGAPEQAERSLREIRLQARLDHPNIAAIHNAFWAGEDLVLVMELIEGCSLRRLLEGGRIPLETAIDYACQALAALTYAHAHGVIHRDVSPSNMMIGPNGVLKLTDFGLAKGAADVQVTQTGAPLGSLYYMSPEQVRGNGLADARSDIYSLGAVLYELVTGKRPFDGDNAFSIMVEQVEKPPVPPIEIEPGLSQPLNSVILKSLEKDPSQRFPSAEEFRQALIAARDCKPVTRPSRAWIVWLAAAIAVVALIVAGIGRSPAPVKPPEAVVEPAPVPAPKPVEQASKPAPNPTPPSVAPAPQKSNPIKRAFGKLWRLPRRRKPAD